MFKLKPLNYKIEISLSTNILGSKTISSDMTLVNQGLTEISNPHGKDKNTHDIHKLHPGGFQLSSRLVLVGFRLDPWGVLGGSRVCFVLFQVASCGFQMGFAQGFSWLYRRIRVGFEWVPGWVPVWLRMGLGQILGGFQVPPRWVLGG